VFELQTMPAMHTALGEGLQWQQSASSSGGDGSSGELSIDAWSWLTIAVFTCSKSCSVGTGYTLVEEHVALADE
jgi:Programmed cell death protein 2, C-terminal putative domain